MYEASFESEYQFTGFKQVSRDISSLCLASAVAEQLDRRRLLDMFDSGIVQKLVGLHLRLEKLKCPDSLEAEVNQLKQLIYSAIKNAHVLADEIAPHLLFKVGLKAAVFELFRRYARECGLRYYINMQNANLGLLDETTNLVLYNIVKLVLDGAVYSCRADNVGISMQTLDSVLEVVLQDNGSSASDFQDITFTGEASEQPFLVEAAAQASSLGGKVWVDKSAGTRTVCLVIPLALEDR